MHLGGVILLLLLLLLIIIAGRFWKRFFKSHIIIISVLLWLGILLLLRFNFDSSFLKLGSFSESIVIVTGGCGVIVRRCRFLFLKGIGLRFLKFNRVIWVFFFWLLFGEISAGIFLSLLLDLLLFSLDFFGIPHVDGFIMLRFFKGEISSEVFRLLTIFYKTVFLRVFVKDALEFFGNLDILRE